MYGLFAGTKSSGSCRTSREVVVSGGSTVRTKQSHYMTYPSRMKFLGFSVYLFCLLSFIITSN